MKRTYCYEVDYWLKDIKGEAFYAGSVTGVTNSPDILASAFRQHSEMLPAVATKLSYYEV